MLQVQEMENSFQTHNPTWVFNQSPVIRIKSTIDRLEAWPVVETARGRISASSYGFNQAICLLPCRAVGQTSFSPDFLTIALTSGVFVLISQSQSFWRVATNHPMLAANQWKNEVCPNTKESFGQITPKTLKTISRSSHLHQGVVWPNHCRFC